MRQAYIIVMNINPDTKTKLFLPALILLGAFCLTPWMPPFLALLAGALVAVVLGNPYQEKQRGRVGGCWRCRSWGLARG